MPRDTLISTQQWTTEGGTVGEHMLDHYGVEGFGVMTSTPIDATLYDKLNVVCGKRDVQQMNFSGLELERELARKPSIHRRYFQK